MSLKRHTRKQKQKQKFKLLEFTTHHLPVRICVNIKIKEEAKEMDGIEDENKGKVEGKDEKKNKSETRMMLRSTSIRGFLYYRWTFTNCPTTWSS